MATATAGHDQRLGRLLRTHTESVMRVFGQRVLDDIGAQRLKAEGDEFTRRILDYIARYTGNKVTRIASTTRGQIRAAIDEGIHEGLGQRGIAKLIRERTGGLIGRFRANVIARTETHQASQAASEAAVGASGTKDKLEREWIAAEDERTRETHSAADGERRKAEEPFDIGSAKLMYPGDPAGPPEETINCRCIVGYVPTDQ